MAVGGKPSGLYCVPASTYLEVFCSDEDCAAGSRAPAAEDVCDTVAGAWKTLRGEGGVDTGGQQVLGEGAEEDSEGEGAVKAERGWVMRKEEERGEVAGEEEDVNIEETNGDVVNSQGFFEHPNLLSV